MLRVIFVEKLDGKLIKKDSLRFLKAHSVLCIIRRCFRSIPFEFYHAYIVFTS